MHRATLLTISDGVSRQGRPDASGDLIATRLAALPAQLVDRRTVPDEPDEIREAVLSLSATSRLLVSSGGTGLGPRDVTPETVSPLLERTVPGMAEAMRAAGLRQTPMAMLSRQLVGVRAGCLVVVLPGSPRAVADCLEAIWDALPHALQLLAGDTAHR